MGREFRRHCKWLLPSAGVLSALYVRWLNNIAGGVHEVLSPEQVQHGVVPVPDWFDQAVRDLPRRRVNDSEREVFRKDGAILLKGLVPDKRILQTMKDTFGFRKQQMDHNWIYNGVMHAVVKHGPLAEIAATALDVPEVTVWNAQVEPRPGMAERPWPLEAKPWLDKHYGDPRDQSVHEDTDAYFGHLHRAGHFVKPQASIFIAVTAIPHGFELLAGSHVANQQHRCARLMNESYRLDAACMDRLERDCHGVRWWDLEPGDAVLFYGSTFHWSVLQENPRLAVSIRYVPADMMYTGFIPSSLTPPSRLNWKCQPIGDCPAFPIFYSKDKLRVKDQPWPILFRNVDNSPWFRVALRLWNDFLAPCGEIHDI